MPILPKRILVKRRSKPARSYGCLRGVLKILFDAEVLGGSTVSILNNKTTLDQKPLTMSILAITLLVVAGTAYRVTTAKLYAISQQPVRLDVPLEKFPAEVGNWSGSDIPISQTILKVAGNDDYLIRKYTNSESGQSVNLYIAFSSRPSTMRGHKPEICYPGNGWIFEDTRNGEVLLDSGRTLACLIHRFHKPLPEIGNAVVLNYYILNGRIVSNEDAFSSLRYRLVNNSRQAKRYVTQVQISSSMANPVISAASEFGDLIFKYFPESTGPK
jgi:EpsI family protein